MITEMIALNKVSLTSKELHDICWGRTKNGEFNGAWLSRMKAGATVHERIEHRRKLKNICELEDGFHPSFLRSVNIFFLSRTNLEQLKSFIEFGIPKKPVNADPEKFQLQLDFHNNRWRWVYHNGIHTRPVKLNTDKLPKGAWIADWKTGKIYRKRK